jgi:hypothetical protein
MEEINDTTWEDEVESQLEEAPSGEDEPEQDEDYLNGDEDDQALSDDEAADELGKMREHQAYLEALGVEAADPRDFIGERAKDYMEVHQDEIEEAETKQREKVMDAELQADAIARRMGASPPPPPDLSPEDWDRLEKAKKINEARADFLAKADKARRNGDLKAAQDFEGRAAYTERELDVVAVPTGDGNLGLEAHAEEHKRLVDDAERMLLEDPENEVLRNAFNRNSNAGYCYARRAVLEKSPFLKGNKIPGDDDEPLIKVSLPSGMTAKETLQEAENCRMSLEDSLLKRGYVTVTREIEEPSPKKPTKSAKELETMSFEDYKKWREKDQRKQERKGQG